MSSAFARVLTLGVAVVTLGGCAPAAAATPPTTTTPPLPSGQWVTQSFHGAGLVVSLDHPVSWRSQLQPLSIHYSATFAFLSNFTLQQFCTHPTTSSFECTWADAGTVPTGGVIVMFGTEGYGPGPGIPAQLLSEGTPTTVDGRRAAEQTGTMCLGVGADHRTTYFVDDGQPQGLFDITFCWRGSSTAFAGDVRAVVSRLTLRPDPTDSGPHPN
jgi:hypothetical protein